MEGKYHKLLKEKEAEREAILPEKFKKVKKKLTPTDIVVRLYASAVGSIILEWLLIECLRGFNPFFELFLFFCFLPIVGYFNAIPLLIPVILLLLTLLVIPSTTPEDPRNPILYRVIRIFGIILLVLMAISFLIILQYAILSAQRMGIVYSPRFSRFLLYYVIWGILMFLTLLVVRLVTKKKKQNTSE